MSTNLLAFGAAAFFEIAGCFAFWVWLRRSASPLVALLGVVSLIAFALTLTRVRIPAHRERSFRANVNTDSDRW